MSGREPAPGAVHAKADDRAFEAHISEFDALRDEINLTLSQQSSLLNFALLIAGGVGSLFAVGQPSIAHQYPGLLLLAALLEFAITWVMAGAGLHISDMGRYIADVISPKLEELIGERPGRRYELLQWEENRARISGRLALKYALKLGSFFVPYMASMAFTILFALIKQQTSPALQWPEVVLLVIVCAMAVAPIVTGVYVIQTAFRCFSPVEPQGSGAGVTGNGKTPRKGKIEFPTLVRWFHLRHNGLVSRSAEERATHAESGEPIHDQRPAP